MAKDTQPVELTGSNLQENPFNTAEGQTVVSLSENFWVRLAREGRYRSENVEGTAGTNGTMAYYATLTPSLGTRLYPKRAIVSCSVDAVLVVEVDTGLADAEIFRHVAFVKAATPLIIEFDGEAACEETGTFRIGVNPLADLGKIYGTTSAVEVTA